MEIEIVRGTYYRSAAYHVIFPDGVCIAIGEKMHECGGLYQPRAKPWHWLVARYVAGEISRGVPIREIEVPYGNIH